MSRPVTLFTGQWADLPFAEVCRLACRLGLRRPRDRFRRRSSRCAPGPDRARLSRRPQAACSPTTDCRSTRSRPTWSDRPCVTIRSISVIRRSCPGRIWGDGEPEGVRTRAAAELKDVARVAAELEVDTVVGFTGSSIWHTLAMFPPVPESMIDRRLSGFRRPVESHPGRLRRARCAVRPRGASQRDRLRLLDNAARPGGGRPPAGIRAELRPEPLRLAGPGPAGVPLGLPRPDLSRRFQGHQEAPRRPQRPARVASALGRPAPGWDFVSTGHGDVDFESCVRLLNAIGYTGPLSVEWEDAGMDRLVGAPDALAYVRKLAAIVPPAQSFDAAFGAGK